jgi:hypothetical protein
MNVTVPVGIPPLPVTVAVKVTGARTVAGEALDEMATAVVARLTASGMAVDALLVSFESPL